MLLESERCQRIADVALDGADGKLGLKTAELSGHTLRPDLALRGGTIMNEADSGAIVRGPGEGRTVDNPAGGPPTYKARSEETGGALTV